MEPAIKDFGALLAGIPPGAWVAIPMMKREWLPMQPR
jgi:hypothetical protein